MCRERCSPKCFIDNVLLTLTIILFMILYMYIISQNPGIIPILIIVSVLTFIIFSIRLEDYGCPNWIKNVGSICRDELIEEEES